MFSSVAVIARMACVSGSRVTSAQFGFDATPTSESTQSFAIVCGGTALTAWSMAMSQ